MNQHDELDQQLWEFVYGLLPEPEGESLRSRIHSDPVVARAYVRVKLQSELVAQAARTEAPTITLPQPAAATRAGEVPVGDAPAHWAFPSRAAPWVLRVANGLTALAATVLICLMGYGLLRSGAAPQAPAIPSSEPILAQVSVPDAVRPDTQNWFFVQTAHPNGSPRTGPVSYRFYDEQRGMTLDGQVTTNAEGWGQFALPASLARSVTRLEIRTGDPVASTIEAPLAQSSTEQLAYLCLDKQAYVPGETVHFRSTVLGELELLADQPVTAEFDVLGPGGGSVLQAPQQVRTEQGIAAGSYTLPPDMQSGQFTVAVHSPEGRFAPSRRAFTVQSPRSLNVELQLARQKSETAAEVLSQVQVYRANGEPAAGARLEVNAVVAGAALAASPAQTSTDERGLAQVRLAMPVALSHAQGALNMRVQDGDRETLLSRELPPPVPQIAVDFVPEAGTLLPGVDNRLYFASRDAWGQPIELSGRVLDTNGRQVAQAQSVFAGKGLFQFTPQAAERYVLAIDEPPQATVQPELPPVSDAGGTLLRVDPATVEAQAPLALQLAVTRPDACVLVAAYCRGAMVGQQLIDRNRFTQAGGTYACDFELSLAEQACGAIRLVAFDCTARPAQAVAERLAFRYPRRRLELRVERQTAQDVSEEFTRLRITATDEAARPIPAVLSVSIVGDPVSRQPAREPTMAAHYYLATELDRPTDIGDGLVYLGADTQSRTALELLLGTQRARRFSSASRESLLLARSAGQAVMDGADAYRDQPPVESPMVGYSLSAGAAGRTVSPERAAGAPAVYDNQAQLKLQLATTSPDPPATAFDRRLLGQVLLLGGALLTLAAVMLALFRLAEHLAYLLPIFATAGASLLIGLMWLRTDHEADVVGRVAQALPSRELTAGKFAAAPEAESQAIPGSRLDVLNRAEDTPAPAASPTLSSPGMPLLSESVTVGERVESLPATVPREPEPLAAPEPQSAARGRVNELAELRMAESEEAPTATDLADQAEARKKMLRRGTERSLSAAGEAASSATSVDVVPPASLKFGAEAGKPVGSTGGMDRTMRGGYGGASPPASASPSPPAPAAPELGLNMATEASPARARGLALRSDAAAERPVTQFGREAAVAHVGTTLYWNPLLIADENGQATIDVPRGRSRNLRIAIDAHAAGRLGSLETTLPASQPPE